MPQFKLIIRYPSFWTDLLFILVMFYATVFWFFNGTPVILCALGAGITGLFVGFLIGLISLTIVFNSKPT